MKDREDSDWISRGENRAKNNTIQKGNMEIRINPSYREDINQYADNQS
jgi:hypothetical protein